MPVDRYFFEGNLEVGHRIVLDDEERHHLKVTRIKIGETIEVVNGQNTLAQGIIQDQFVLIRDVTKKPPSFNITLVQGICKWNHLEWILEKGCELGMTKMILFPGERSEKINFSEQQKKRMSRLLIGAMKQCGRLDLPEIEIALPLKEWKSFPAHSYFGDIDSNAPLFSHSWQEVNEMAFFVGPESGFSEKEKEVLRKGEVQGVRLHPYILRTETAPLMALSLISHWMFAK